MQKKNILGGKREGSGRKKLPNPRTVKLSVSFSEADYKELREKHPKYGELSRAVSELSTLILLELDAGEIADLIDMIKHKKP